MSTQPQAEDFVWVKGGLDRYWNKTHDMSVCGPKPWMVMEGDDEPIGERRHHVCVCGLGSKKCYDGDYNDIGEEQKVWVPGTEEEVSYDDAVCGICA